MRNSRVFTEGSEEWASVIIEDTIKHLLARHDVIAAHLFTKKLVDEWDTLDEVLRASLFQSAVTVYARPFVDNRSSTGRNRRFSISGLKNAPGFHRDLHDHVVDLRRTLIAHHDMSVVKAQLSHMTVTNDEDQKQGKPPLTVQTEGKVKALHAIARKEIAEQYLKHMASSAAYLYSTTHAALAKLHRLRMLYPNLGIEKMKSLSLEFERLSNDTFRLPFANPKPIDEPAFNFPSNSYIWLEYTQTFYEVGPLSANGEPMIEVLDLEEKSGRPPNPTAINPYAKRSGS
jgi:hypothetical protein